MLLRLHWLVHLVQRTRETFRQASTATRAPPTSTSIPTSEATTRAQRAAHVLLHRLAGLAAALLEHALMQAEGEGWRALEAALDPDAEGVDVLSLRGANHAFAVELGRRCFSSAGGGVEGLGVDVDAEVDGLVAMVAEVCAGMEAALVLGWAAVGRRVVRMYAGVSGGVERLVGALNKRREEDRRGGRGGHESYLDMLQLRLDGMMASPASGGV
jgi:hypothetical protein